jgi:hypothetical protein
MIPIYGTKISIPDNTVFEEFVWGGAKYKLLTLMDCPFCYYPNYLNEKSVIYKFFDKYMNYQGGYPVIGSKYRRSIKLSIVLPKINLVVPEKFEYRKFELNCNVNKTLKIEKYRLEQLWYDTDPFISFYVLDNITLEKALEIIREDYLK